MSRVQLALNVADIDTAVEFYSKLFGAEPAKRRPGYANFAIANPPLKLVLIETAGARADGVTGALNHLGVEVEIARRGPSGDRRLAGRAFDLDVRESTTCCYAVQDKVWVNDPDGAPWEVYAVLADALEESDRGVRRELLHADGHVGACPLEQRANRPHRVLSPRTMQVTIACSVASSCRRIPGQCISGRHRDRVGHRSPTALAWQYRTGATRKRGSDGGGSLRHHSHVRPRFGCSLQPGGVLRGCHLWWDQLAILPWPTYRPRWRMYWRCGGRQPDVLQGSW